MTMQPNKKFRVAICGAGVGGLVFAVALSKYPDIDIDIYEAASKFTEVGAGVGIWPRPWRVLESLGLSDDLLKKILQRPTDEFVSTIRFRKSDQPIGQDFHTLVSKGDVLRYHRADFHGVLLQHLPPTCGKYLSKRLKSYIQPSAGPIQLLFEDGSQAECDVLIGADGVRSATRQSMLIEQAKMATNDGHFKIAAEALASKDPLWSGTISFRTLIPAERLKAISLNHRLFRVPMVQYCGKNATIMTYRVSQGSMVNFAAFVVKSDLKDTKFDGPWVKEVSRDEVAHHFMNFEAEVQELIQCIDKATQWSVHVLRPLPTFYFGRVAILGDAAHSMTPFQGSGAGQAIEDACILATVLGHPQTTRTTISKALAIYDQIRRPFATDIADRSFQNGNILTFQHSKYDLTACPEDFLRDELAKCGEFMQSKWEWTWLSSLDSALEEAIRLLNEEASNSN